MSETSPEPMKASPFLLRHFVWIAIGAVLLVAVVGVLSVWMPYQREQQVAREIEAAGGSATFDFTGPDWIPDFVRGRLPLWTHVTEVIVGDDSTTDAELPSFNGIPSLRFLYLNNTQVSDAGLEHLKRLPNLNWLVLRGARITDAGLVHLKGLPNLERIDFRRTAVTNSGISELEKALPKLGIEK